MNDQVYTLGIDMGGTKILAAVINGEGQILSRAKNKTRAELGQEAVVERIVETANEALATAQLDPGQIECLGIGAPGPLNPASGVILEAPNLKWKNVPLKSILEDKLGIESHLCNDVNAGAWGEYKRGAAEGTRSCVGVFVGTGIGGGVVIGGKLWEGANHIAGEIGHMCIDPKGPVCGCGRRGCMEAFSSRTAMTREVREALKGDKKARKQLGDEGVQIRSKQFKLAFESGDKVFVKVIKNGAKQLGIGLGSVANLLNPECFVLGGGLVEALGKPYLDLVVEAFRRQAFESAQTGVRIVEAALGDDAGVIGAALLARQARAGLEVAASGV